MSRPAVQRATNAWWCDYHNEVHLGPITSWGVEHRAELHPLYIHRAPGNGAIAIHIQERPAHDGFPAGLSAGYQEGLRDGRRGK